MNGSGGDELYAGYGRNSQLPIEKKYLRCPEVLRKKLIEPMIDIITTREVSIERAVARKLGASCQLPLAVFCEFQQDTENFRLRARLAMPDGSCHCSVDMYSSDEESLGYEAAENLINQGAKTVINALN